MADFLMSFCTDLIGWSVSHWKTTSKNFQTTEMKCLNPVQVKKKILSRLGIFTKLLALNKQDIRRKKKMEDAHDMMSFADSGQDFSSRWFSEGSTMAEKRRVQSRDFIPDDMNSFFMQKG